MRYSIRKKLISGISAALIIAAIFSTVVFYSNSMGLINQMMAYQGRSAREEILNDLETFRSGGDHMRYLLLMNGGKILDDALIPNKKIESIIGDIDDNFRLQTIIQPVYNYQQDLLGFTLYSEQQIIMSMGRVDDGVTAQLLDLPNTAQYFYEAPTPTLPFIEEFRYLDRVSGHSVTLLNLNTFMDKELNQLPKGSIVQVQEQGETAFQYAEQEVDTFNERDYFKVNIPIADTDFEFLVHLPKALLLGNMQVNLKVVIFFNVMMIIAVMTIILVIILRLVRNLQKLNTGMQSVKNNDLTANVQINSGDELEAMGNIFNTMVTQIQTLITEKQLEVKEKNEIEMDFLQAQINPHFLSNTLNTITWMAEVQEVDNIYELSKSLTNMLEFSMYKGRDLISLQEELDHVTSYINILRVAYSGNFEVFFDIDENVRKAQVVRFILQPLVENSILHNFVSVDPDFTGELIISAKKVQQELEITVFDNGSGMDLETIDRIMDKKIKNNSYSRIGVKNVDRRIKLFCGEGYGLSYESELGKFTIVKVVLPYQEVLEDDQSNHFR